MDKVEARLALGIVEGLVRESPGAEELALDVFDSLEQAAVAYAYLSGFLLEILAENLGMTGAEAASLVRARLDRLAGA